MRQDLLGNYKLNQWSIDDIFVVLEMDENGEDREATVFGKELLIWSRSTRVGECLFKVQNLESNCDRRVISDKNFSSVKIEVSNGLIGIVIFKRFYACKMRLLFSSIGSEAC